MPSFNILESYKPCNISSTIVTQSYRQKRRQSTARCSYCWLYSPTRDEDKDPMEKNNLQSLFGTNLLTFASMHGAVLVLEITKRFSTGCWCQLKVILEQRHQLSIEYVQMKHTLSLWIHLHCKNVIYKAKLKRYSRIFLFLWQMQNLPNTALSE